ncbi:MAG: DNA-3-methyladenine glycosylase 2 family protein [Candidatus Nanopelagicaceae bacterium]|jgi:DNA-3-methyladenine glycosylase II|nr:DNA-3-methyladenine glycosylase 2 family protein [Candidatus Nanopelagicaceae bacterium]
MRKIVQEIAHTDKRFAKVIETSELCDIGTSNPERSHFETLVSSVISQQLATAAARTIKERFAVECGKITPKNVAAMEIEQMRAAGLSGAKAKTIQGLASSALDKSVDFKKLHEMDDDQVYKSLTSLWGIGPWTVDMFMMFQLGRLDIWPTGDLGVRRGWEKLHKLSEEIAPIELEKKGEKFRPHRSIVAWYCWRALDI